MFATLVVGSIVNFSLMYLLAPTGPAGSAAAGGLIARIFSDQILTSWGAPGEQERVWVLGLLVDCLHTRCVSMIRQ